MSYTRYKTFGNRKYAYEVKSYWDRNLKKPRQKIRYIGVVDELGNIIEKKDCISKEKLILDFGDTGLVKIIVSLCET